MRAGIVTVLCMACAGYITPQERVLRVVDATGCSRSCAFSTNLAWDSIGSTDARQGTWGTAGTIDVPISFVNVPSGNRVRVLRAYGDFISWLHGTQTPSTPPGALTVAPNGTYAGALFGLTTTSSGQSAFVAPGLGSAGCFLYIQQGVGREPARAPLDFDTSAAGLLDADNVMHAIISVFLNQTGLSVHSEPSLVVVFRYEHE